MQQTKKKFKKETKPNKNSLDLVSVMSMDKQDACQENSSLVGQIRLEKLKREFEIISLRLREITARIG